MSAADKTLTSIANPLVKEVLRLHGKQGRLETGLFLIEGRRELDIAAQRGVEIVRFLYNPEKCSFSVNLGQNFGEKIKVSNRVLERISYRGSTEGFIAVAKARQKDLRAFKLPASPLIVVLDKLEKPGNIGAILRTAAAAGIDAVLLSDTPGDLYNPNLIRASLGAIFSLPVFNVSANEALNWLNSHKIKIITASPYAKKTHFDYDFSASAALIIGSEADGVSEIWAKNAADSVLIPMSSAVDSLNASVSVAVLIYEALRQRRK
ncbi:tRNA G18 (ribose-2'-O)-methylase SpoU [Candidatus Termititenax aidoneus]|uniref:tRNA G18 (Ribose-2'-O)-methylase SpoU n=1 Tax=Termititenax aidoneus TaxID=2218524 RepID=A0A388T9X3_TERA1|nr:tRNA G18 (ribose-2'-O)-methylase SpoU [Candidatus Termititenax aidoneus]